MEESELDEPLLVISVLQVGTLTAPQRLYENDFLKIETGTLLDGAMLFALILPTEID